MPVSNATMMLVALATLAASAAHAADDVLIADFEGSDYGEWKVSGRAFGRAPATGPRHGQRLSGFRGKGLVNSFTEKEKDAPTGRLISPPFAVTRRYINFLIAGGRYPEKTCINLLIRGNVLRSKTGHNSDTMLQASWDVSDLTGAPARIEIVDIESGPWGHIEIDHIMQSDTRAVDTAGMFHTTFTYSPAKELGYDAKWTRRDPSDVLEVAGTYYVWYTKTDKDHSGCDATVFYATSTDGKSWNERGEAIGRGEAPDAWDAAGVFSPNILAARGQYYIFYTAMPKNDDLDGTPSAIGLAVAESPDGPWTKFEGNPVLTVAADPDKFDSFRVDDACLIVRDGKYWLYYMGRQVGRSPAQTQTGLAIAEKPTGPYEKHKANPVIPAGHEVLVWPHGKGVSALVCLSNPAVWYAPDGITFTRKAAVSRYPEAPGAFRPDAFTDTARGRGITWGISQQSRPRPHLVRYDCKLVPPAEE